jgi:hypothetical protein
MTHTIPLPPLPDLTALTHTAHPALAAITPRLLAPRQGVAHYEDSPYITAAHDPEPDEDDGPWCRRQP